MPVLETRGAASARGYGLLSGQGGSGAVIEDVFSTWLYTGTGSTQTITNGIDLSTQGGLVWMKGRSGATDHALYDTARGATKDLASNTTSAETTQSTGLTAFGTTGFSIGALAKLNTSSATYASWTFRKAPKFFDVVTYTGNGSNRTIAHSLGSVPGCIIVKRTDTAADWQVYHRINANTEYMVLNSTAAKATGDDRWNSTTPTSTVFSIGVNPAVNASGGTYVAYLFAHDAGGFGASGTDNVIACGSFFGGLGQNITLGWEPQFILYKRTDNDPDSTGWFIFDTMRGLKGVSVAADPNLRANASSAETDNGSITVNATGFYVQAGGAGSPHIYIAIRRGPMRTPTSGTSVFAPSARSGTGATGSSTALGNVTDLAIIKQRGSTQTWAWTDRLRGARFELTSAATTVENGYFNDVTGFDSMTGFAFGSGASGQVNSSGSTYIDYLLRRAPGFFDVVCYTGTGANRTVSHNLGAVPELMIVKRRSATDDWWFYDVATGNTKYQVLNSTATPITSSTAWNNTTPTSSVFSVGTGTPVNASEGTYVAYLFATVAGVSKVGSYTGNGSSQAVDCDFTGGARFVLVKRTDSAGDWYVWDTARGIVAGNDPRLSLNTTAAEVTTDDSVDTDSTGFVVNQVSTTNINVSSATYIFLAVA